LDALIKEMELKTNLMKIKDYYQKALKEAKNNNVKEASDIIYNKLGDKLYDMSLDIVYSKKLYMNELDKEIPLLIKELKSLIPKVDTLINSKIGYKEPDDLGVSHRAIIANSNDDEWYNEQY